MNCRFTRRRLVAWMDGELAPAEAALVEEHLHGCASCTDRAERLDAWTPEAPVVALDDQARHAMHLRLDAALDAAWNAPEPAPRRPWDDAVDLLRGDVSVPRGLVALYAAALLVAIGLAAGRTLAPPSADPGATAATTPTPLTETTAQASESARPAAYTPEEGWF